MNYYDIIVFYTFACQIDLFQFLHFKECILSIYKSSGLLHITVIVLHGLIY